MAATSEKRWLHSLLEDVISLRTCKYTVHSRRNLEKVPLNYDSLLMEIPTSGNDVEIPIFLVPSFLSYKVENRKNKIDTIVATLKSYNVKIAYKTAALCLREALKGDFCSSRLLKVTAKISKDIETVFYVTCGAIFDMHFNPIMVMTYDLHEYVNDPPLFKLNKVNVRIDPSVLLYKESDVEKFIVNKILTKILTAQLGKYNIVSRPIKCNPIDNRITTDTLTPIEVIINKIPFKTKKANSPGTKVDSRELLNVALDHLEEAVI